MSTLDRKFIPARELALVRSTPHRGRDVRKMPKPYTCREVVFTCSNGYRIERCPEADWALESLFMGHCLGTKDNHLSDVGQVYSLRRPDGTPHATILGNRNRCTIYGRCNKMAKPEYIKLVREWSSYVIDTAAFFSEGVDDDEQYHKRGVLDDRDYRDLEAGEGWRDKEWWGKRRVETRE